jgi:hypothetical protein
VALKKRRLWCLAGGLWPGRSWPSNHEISGRVFMAFEHDFFSFLITGLLRYLVGAEANYRYNHEI